METETKYFFIASTDEPKCYIQIYGQREYKFTFLVVENLKLPTRRVVCIFASNAIRLSLCLLSNSFTQEYRSCSFERIAACPRLRAAEIIVLFKGVNENKARPQ